MAQQTWPIATLIALLCYILTWFFKPARDIVHELDLLSHGCSLAHGCLQYNCAWTKANPKEYICSTFNLNEKVTTDSKAQAVVCEYALAWEIMHQCLTAY